MTVVGRNQVLEVLEVDGGVLKKNHKIIAKKLKKHKKSLSPPQEKNKGVPSIPRMTTWVHRQRARKVVQETPVALGSTFSIWYLVGDQGYLKP